MAGALAITAATAQADTLNVTIVAGHPPVFRWVKHASETFIPAVNTALEATGIRSPGPSNMAVRWPRSGMSWNRSKRGWPDRAGVQPVRPGQASSAKRNLFHAFVHSDATFVAEWMDQLQITNEAMKTAWADNGLEYLGGAIGIDDYLLMTNFPINSIADLDGKKIGAPGPAVNWLKGTGAGGVSGNLTTYYNEIKTGVYDGVIVFASAALPGKLHEVAPYITKVGFGAQYARAGSQQGLVRWAGPGGTNCLERRCNRGSCGLSR